MPDPRAPLFASVARKQASIEPEAGDIFLRDNEPLVVVRGPDPVGFITASGVAGVLRLEDFRARAVDPVGAQGGGASYLDNVWQLANSTGIQRDVRALAVQRAARRAPSEADRLIVRRWAGSLSSGMEPRRNA